MSNLKYVHCSRCTSEFGTFFVETEKKTTRCYFLGFIFAYVTYWMKYRGLKYGVDIYHRHTCSTFIRSKVALYLKWYSYTLSIPIKTPSFIFYWLNFSLISFYSIFFQFLLHSSRMKKKLSIVNQPIGLLQPVYIYK